MGIIVVVGLTFPNVVREARGPAAGWDVVEDDLRHILIDLDYRRGFGRNNDQCRRISSRSKVLSVLCMYFWLFFELSM